MLELRNKARTGKTRVWRIEVQGDQVITEYGELGGKLQRVADTAKPKNVGRSNEVSAEDVAIQQMEREILLKRRGGYRAVGEEARENVLNFESLPENLSFYKPDNSLSKTLLKKIEAELAWFSRKRNGEMMVIVVREFHVDIYSRKMLKTHHLELTHPWNIRFDHIVVELLEEFDHIPANSILLGEMVANPEDDARWLVAGVLKSKTEEALAKQKEHGNLHFCCWDIAFWGGEDWVSTKPVRERYAQIQEVFKDGEYLLPVEYFTHDDIMALAEEWGADIVHDNREVAMNVAAVRGWEGFVVIDPDGVYGDKAFNFRGKTDRPGKFSGKLKPEFEDDFVALWDPKGIEGLGEYGKFGRGKRQLQVGSVELYQYDTADPPNLVYICDCGGGIIKTDKFADAHSVPSDYPMVLEVKYNDRTYTKDGEKTNALQFPRVVRIRTDKMPDECISEKL